MVVIDSIDNGIVIDHITAGMGMKVLEYLDLDTSNEMIAFIMNADSKKHGKKDIIKIANVTDVNLDALGLVDHNATVNVIEDEKIKRKIKLNLPEKVVNVIRCKNPRCVTSLEKSIPHVFYLCDEETEEYRCEYCDEIVKTK